MSGALGALLGGAVGLVTGVLSGFGVGGGTLLLLWLTMGMGMEQVRAGGVNLLYFISCAVPAIWGHIRGGLVEKQALIWCVAAGLPVSIGAALAAAGMGTGTLRKVFGVFLVIAGLREAFSKKKPLSEAPPKNSRGAAR